MTATEYLQWYEDQPKGKRYELVDGVPYAMSPERVRHGRIKGIAFIALRAAITKQNLPCEALPDGMSVQIDEDTVYEPDALVVCNQELDGDEIVIPNPVIVVEVLSPGTKNTDTGAKYHAYFSLPSIRHYLVIDPIAKIIMHHFRTERGTLETAVISSGLFTLSSPGLELAYSDIF